MHTVYQSSVSTLGQGFRDNATIQRTLREMFSPDDANYLRRRPLRLQFYADNVGLFFGHNCPIHEYIGTYQRFRKFVLSSKSEYREELKALQGKKNGASGNSGVPASGKFQGRRFKNKVCLLMDLQSNKK